LATLVSSTRGYQMIRNKATLSAVETTVQYRIVQVMNVLKNTDLLRAQISLEHCLNSLLI
jgi:hypothetical protein